LAVNSFTLSSAQDAAFTIGVTNLGSFNATEGLNAQTYTVTGDGEFVRLEVNSNHSPTSTQVNIGEVAFDTELLPEPASLAILAVGCAAVSLTRRRGIRRRGVTGAKSRAPPHFSLAPIRRRGLSASCAAAARP